MIFLRLACTSEETCESVWPPNAVWPGLTKTRKCRRNLFSAKLEVLKWRHNHSQSPVFGLAVLYPTGSEISRFWFIKTQGRKIAIEYIFCLSLHCGDFIEQLKKHPSYSLSVLKQFNNCVFFSVNMSLSLTVFPDPFWVSLTRTAAILKTCYKYAWNRPYSLYRHVCFRIIMLILLVTNYS